MRAKDIVIGEEYAYLVWLPNTLADRVKYMYRIRVESLAPGGVVHAVILDKETGEPTGERATSEFGQRPALTRHVHWPWAQHLQFKERALAEQQQKDRDAEEFRQMLVATLGEQEAAAQMDRPGDSLSSMVRSADGRPMSRSALTHLLRLAYENGVRDGAAKTGTSA